MRKRYDPKKESTIRDLIRSIEENGVQVRREELKRGLGWRAVSGRCRAIDKNFIFLDRRLTQDEQIDFLKGQFGAVQCSGL